MPEQLIIGFNPMSAANRVAYFGKQIRVRIWWLVVAIVLCVWIWIWQKGTLTPFQGMLLLGLGVVYSLVWVGVAVVGWIRAKSNLSSISPGVAAAIDRGGIWLQGASMAWPQIDKISINPARFGGSPNFCVKREDGFVASISLANLDVMPGTIDAAIRSYSAGTRWINTSKLGN